METRNLAHTSSSIPPPDIPFNSQQHNHLLSEAVGHIYSNDLPNAAAASMVSHEQQHIGSTDTPFIPEILDWDHHLLDLPLDFSPIQMEEEDGGILPSDENPIMSPYWNHLILDTSSTSASKLVCVFYFY